MIFGARMKSLIATLLVIASAPALPCESMEGAWELVYAVYKDESGKVLEENKGDADKSIKVLSKKNFSFITKDKGGKFLVAAAGTYSLEAGKYIEVVGYSSMDRLMGKTYRFDCAMKDGLWIHSGKEDHLLIEEHWKRLK
jgi:hypothetical protein